MFKTRGKGDFLFAYGEDRSFREYLSGEGAKTRGFRNLVNTSFLFIKLFTLRCMSIIRNSFSLVLWSFAHTFAVPCLAPIHFQCAIKGGHYYESSNYPDKAPVVQKLDSAIHNINLYPVDSAIGFPNTYPLERFIQWVALFRPTHRKTIRLSS